jgi:molecular chaperone DnaK (HSP70)
MILGIDFGTTRTVVAAVDRGNYPVISFHTESGDAQPWYPSLVAARAGEYLFGFSAAERQNEPGWLILRSFKRLLRTFGPNSPIALGQHSLTALELMTGFLLQLRQDLIERSNLRRKSKGPFEAMISVPANANNNQRFITLEAFRRAGFTVRGMINEPSAAGIEYAHHYLSQTAGARREQVVIYDLGGGTFDASVINIAERRHEVISSDGIAQLGGDDFDQILLELALGQAGISVLDLSELECYRLLEECREKKEGLHPNTRKVAIELGRALAEAGEVIININDFYERCRPLLQRTIATMEGVMQKALLSSVPSVAAIYLVGGSSELPLVSRLLRERYGRQVRKSPYPHAATAIGLAIMADTEAGYSLRERFTRHFGVWREAEDGRAVTFDVLFEKDTPLPGPGQKQLICSRRYRPAHNIGHFRYLECSEIDERGQPSGDLTPWDEVYFPFDPALQNEPHLERIPIIRNHLGEHLIEERYSCNQQGIIEVEIINYATDCRRSYQLRGKK